MKLYGDEIIERKREYDLVSNDDHDYSYRISGTASIQFVIEEAVQYLKNNNPAKPTIRWQLAIVACLLCLSFAGSAGAMSMHQAQLTAPDDSTSEVAKTDAHAMHKMDSASKPCTNPKCQYSECAMSCAMSGGCVSPGVVCLPNVTIDTRSLKTEPLPTVPPTAFTSRQAESLFRPPIL